MEQVGSGHEREADSPDGLGLRVSKVRPQVGGPEIPEGLRGLQEPILERAAWGRAARPTNETVRATYRAWWNMVDRCTNPLCETWKHYGRRGIKVCDRWLVYEAFVMDMGLRPAPQLSLDRIDNDGHYEPGNCRWATRAQQNANRRRSKKVEPDQPEAGTPSPLRAAWLAQLWGKRAIKHGVAKMDPNQAYWRARLAARAAARVPE